jgi:hypothetical protein
MLGGAQNSRRSNGDLASSQREIGARHRAGRAQGEDRGETGPVFSKKVEAAVRPLRAEVCVVQGRVRMVGVTGQYLTRGERKGGRLPRPHPRSNTSDFCCGRGGGASQSIVAHA